jgi:hypothetical protein
MAFAVTDSFSNRNAHVDEALSILGSSQQKWAIFLAVYKGKKVKKSVDEIAEATDLTTQQVLNAAKPLARAGLFNQEGHSPTNYLKIEEITHIRNRIIAKRGKGKKASLPNSKPNPKAQSSRQTAHATRKQTKKSLNQPKYDVFISHASEDKRPFVSGLANRIKEEGISVWYDEFTLQWGDRLRASIDKGLANSQYGIVVLSPDFFKKDWPQEELEGLFALEVGGEIKILPIWHNLTREQIAQFSPMLAGRLAVSSSDPIEVIIDKLKSRLG